MKKFKVGQIAYYCICYDESYCRIITCMIKKATKDLSTGQITYTVGSDNSWLDNRCLTADYLYSSKKKIIKEHKDELAYARLHERIDTLEKSINRIFDEYSEKIELKSVDWCNLITNTTNSPTLYIEGVGDVKEELNKLKKEVENIKKKIKKPTKKTVIKKEKESIENGK